jgi:hypothetical protein
VGSGVIYAVIVVLWAVVLVPMWLRRHDEATASRSVDRFQGAMRTLSRRDSAGDRREVLVPRRNASRAVPDGAAEQLSAAAAAAVRRRRTVLALAGLTVLLSGLGALKLLPLWTALLPFVLLCAFLAQASLAARRARGRELAARRARAGAMRRANRQSAERAAASGDYGDSRHAQRNMRGRQAGDPFDQELADRPRPQVQQARTTAPASARAGHDQDPAFYDAVAEHVWEPVPVPLPTYVLAPRAPRSVRVIDLTKPGHWTSGHLDAEPVEAGDIATEPQQGGTEPIQRDGIVTGEVLVERLRAVGD